MSHVASPIQPHPSLAELAGKVNQEFRRRFGRGPRWMAAAPGRVNLIGEHTDYNDGFVLPMAIDRYVVVAADRPAASGDEVCATAAQVFSTAIDEWSTVALESSTPSPGAHWSKYVEGVLAGCRAIGMEPGPFDAVIDSDVPLGGGLSSSAALEVATATLVEAITGRQLDPRQKALLCQKAEHDYAGVPCGIMDQFSSVLGQEDCLLLLDCRSREVETVPLADRAVRVLIVNSNVKRELAAGEYAKRRAECEAAARALGVAQLRDVTPPQLEQSRESLDAVLFRRARHVVSENERTVAAAEAVRRKDWDALGLLMYASHTSLRDDYEVSCDELDLLVDLAAALGPSDGVIGSRLTGGGFGGCTVSLVKAEAVDSVARAIFDKYQRQTGIAPTIFATRPSQGAAVLDLAALGKSSD